MDQTSQLDNEKEYLCKDESFISHIFFLYVNKLVDKGLKQTLEYEDLYRLNDDMYYDQMYPKFEKYYFKRKAANPKIGLGPVLVRHFLGMHLIAVLFAILGVL